MNVSHYAVVLMIALLWTGSCSLNAASDTTMMSVDTTEAKPDTIATLYLDRDTFALDVQTCMLSGETDDEAPTLYALYEAPGAILHVEATRSRLRGSLIHRIEATLRDGDRDLMTHVAERTYGLGAWTSLRDGPEEPLLTVHGDTLSATGRFGRPHPNEHEALVDGRLHAVCPQ